MLVSFPFDSVALLREPRFVLDEVARILARDPTASATITGYADSLGDASYNLQLSRDRAAAVRAYLVETGIDIRRLQVEGRGVVQGEVDTSDAAVGSDEMQRIVKIRIARGRP